MSRIFEALDFAKMAHAGQLRKYTGDPYVMHPIRVAALVMAREDATEAMIIAALLHDVPEDTKYNLDHVTIRFGTEVADLVDELTNKSKGSPLLPRAERKKMDRDRLAMATREAKVIKLLDRLDNLREMGGADAGFRRKYASESLMLLDAVGSADPATAALVRAEADKLGG
jgi:(p)ppGpp synthase/HD superfamily hydrolase